MTAAIPLHPHECDAIMPALSTGTVPPTGWWHTMVGRVHETRAALDDLSRVGKGAASCRFIIGDFGDGKSSILRAVEGYALNSGLVVMRVDLTRDRLLYGTKGQAQAFYREGMKKLAVARVPVGQGVEAVLQSFVRLAEDEVASLEEPLAEVVRKRLKPLLALEHGYDFAGVVEAYCRGHEAQDSVLMAAAVRWVKGEYVTPTEARAALGVQLIVDDANYYSMLKLFARFVRESGFQGLVVCVDELVTLMRLASTPTRLGNLDQLLVILNDCTQGGVEGLGFFCGGTPDLLNDEQRGLASYEALKTRLAPNPFAQEGLVDTSGPVLTLQPLTPEEVLALLHRIRHVEANGDVTKYRIPDEGIDGFVQHCHQVGDAHFQHVRTRVVAFVRLLALLEQNPGVHWSQLLPGVGDAPADLSGNNNELASFVM